MNSVNKTMRRWTQNRKKARLSEKDPEVLHKCIEALLQRVSSDNLERESVYEAIYTKVTQAHESNCAL